MAFYTRWFLVLLALWCGVGGQLARGESKRTGIEWQPWSDDIFDRAAATGKLVILDLEAVWCHWCHVMDQRTYADPSVVAIVKRSYLAVRVDQDSRPDLSNRYREYGWPATIIFDGTGRELSASAGFIEPEKMRELLEKLAANPTPLVSMVEEDSAPPGLPAGGVVSPVVLEQLRAKQYAAIDEARGGLKTRHKFLEADSIEYSLIQGARGASRDAEFVRRTLAFNRKLIDPIWGGVYQYSTHGDWDHPHFEKIAAKQSDNMRLYAAAHTVWGDPTYRAAAEGIARYLDDFLSSPDGGFYTSQDADVVRGEHAATYFRLSDVMRRQHGIPAVDTNMYARENGWFIRALVALSDATGEAMHLDRAKKAARWVIANRSLVGGGYRHGERDSAGPYLGDTLSMGQAFLALYASTGEREWLTRANDAAIFVTKNFVVSGAEGALTAVARTPRDPLPPRPVLAENIELARFANLLGRYVGQDSHRGLATTALRYIGEPRRALEAIVESGILLAAQEFGALPLHITVVGGKGDPAALALFTAARRYYSPYKRVEWWDRAEGLLMNHDVEYPELPRAAVFVCTERRCSLPLYDAAKLPTLLDQLAPKS